MTYLRWEAKDSLKKTKKGSIFEPSVDSPLFTISKVIGNMMAVLWGCSIGLIVT